MDVAVKSLQSPDNPTDKESFEKEMAISADPKLNHPNIVKVYGLVEGGICDYSGASEYKGQFGTNINSEHLYRRGCPYSEVQFTICFT